MHDRVVSAGCAWVHSICHGQRRAVGIPSRRRGVALQPERRAAPRRVLGGKVTVRHAVLQTNILIEYICYLPPQTRIYPALVCMLCGEAPVAQALARAVTSPHIRAARPSACVCVVCVVHALALALALALAHDMH